MRKLSEIRGEEALDVLADLLEPASDIFTDAEVVKNIRKKDRMNACKVVLKNHKDSILTILAILNGVDRADYNPSIVELPLLILSLLNDPDMLSVFYFADTEKPSGSATENIGGTEKA